MTFIEKAESKLAAYKAAGYKCSDIETGETFAKFTASDHYGVTREHIFGESPKTTPLLEKVKAKTPAMVEPPVEPQPAPPAKKSRKKKGE